MLKPEEIFEAGKKLCQAPIPANAEKQLDELKKQLPAKYHADFNWFYEALFVAQSAGA